MLSRLLLSGAAALSVAAAAAPALAQPVPPPPPAPEFVKKAGASDLYEITSSRTVLQSTQDPALRRFAEMMMEHHTKTTADAKAAAAADRVPAPPPALMPAQAQMIKDLTAAKGPARDKLYLTQQLGAHREALALMRNYGEAGDKPNLKAAAQKTAPIVESHLTEATKLYEAGFQKGG